ncbi:serine/threonine-protein kinase [Candidatus Uabimicrobium sp. HlEnr_7]|uniref:serine/threonine-protein kinase n=1 Tax=Candidatus Uabimicrobium helgolandensis TaxID=3095367 RepID=UPI003555EBA2
MTNEFDRKLKNCAKLCYGEKGIGKMPRYKLKNNEISNSILEKFQHVSQKSPTRQKENTMEIAGYNVIKKLGQGGMGAVYQALQLSMERTVAIKVLSKQRQTKDYVARFQREAHSVAKLNHKHIITGIDAGTNDDFHYFVMEYIAGKNVAQLIDSDPLPVNKALEIVTQVSEALEYADRQHNIIHRDIKPENIMIRTEDSHAKLCDLGLARCTNASTMTVSGRIMGTPHYMSPEQCRGESGIDKRSDIYSLGITLFHMVTGEKPFDAPHAAAICLKHISTKLPNPKKFNKNLPDNLYPLILKMSAKSKSDRFQNYSDLIKALKNINTLTVRPTNKIVNTKTPVTKLTRTSRMRSSRVSPPPQKSHWKLWASSAAAVIFFFILLNSVGVSPQEIQKQISQKIDVNNLEKAYELSEIHSDISPQIKETKNYLSNYLSLKEKSQDEKNDSAFTHLIDNGIEGPSWYVNRVTNLIKQVQQRKQQKIYAQKAAQNRLRLDLEKDVVDSIKISDIYKLQEALLKIKNNNIATKWGESFIDQENTLWEMMVAQIIYISRNNKNKEQVISVLQNLLEQNFSETVDSIVKKEITKLSSENIPSDEFDWQEDIKRVQTLVTNKNYQQAGNLLKDFSQQNHKIKNHVIAFIEKKFDHKMNKVANININVMNIKPTIEQFLDAVSFYSHITELLNSKHSIHDKTIDVFQTINNSIYNKMQRIDKPKMMIKSIEHVSCLYTKTIDELPNSHQQNWKKIISNNLSQYLALNSNFVKELDRCQYLLQMNYIIDEGKGFIGDKVQNQHREMAKTTFNNLTLHMLKLIEQAKYWQVNQTYESLNKYKSLDELEFAAVDGKIIDTIESAAKKVLKDHGPEQTKIYYERLQEQFPEDEEIAIAIEELCQNFEEQDNPQQKEIVAGQVKKFEGNWLEINYPFYRPKNRKPENMEKDWFLFRYAKKFKPLKLKMYSPKFILLNKKEVVLWKYPLKPNYFHLKAYLVNPENNKMKREFKNVVANVPNDMGKAFGAVLFYRPNKPYYLFLFNMQDRRNRLYIVNKGKQKLIHTSEDSFSTHREKYELWLQYQAEDGKLNFSCGGANSSYIIENEHVEPEGFVGLVASDWLATPFVEIQSNLNMEEFPENDNINLQKAK